MPSTIRSPHVALPGEPVYCPNGHKIDHDVWPINEDPMVAKRCSFKWQPGNAGLCGECVYWFELPGDYRIVVHVTSSEAYEMQQKRMGVKEALAYVGLRWTRPVDVAKPPHAAPPSAGVSR
jgi:hypothetical protein